jgi:hypothetical protein
MKAVNLQSLNEAPVRLSLETPQPPCLTLEQEACAMAPMLVAGFGLDPHRFYPGEHDLESGEWTTLADRIRSSGKNAAIAYTDCVALLPQLHKALLRAHARGCLDADAAMLGISTPIAKRAVQRATHAMMHLLVVRLSEMGQ